MPLTLFTSGSTDSPKNVIHSWGQIEACARASINEMQLHEGDRVLDVYPANTIAHYTITAYPAILSRATLVSSTFNPYSYIKDFKKINPTVISLIPKHFELLKSTKGFSSLDMSSVRYMVTGSSKIDQSFIDAFRSQGVQLVANWYGMTEFPPPVMVGYNSTQFTKIDHMVSFDNNKQCLIKGNPTNDFFTHNMEFSHRGRTANNTTWKTNF